MVRQQSVFQPMFLLVVLLLALCWPLPYVWADGTLEIAPFPMTGAYQAHHREDQQGIALIEFAGNYDKELENGAPNVEARAVVAREFLRTHADAYDFLVVFSTFEFASGEAVAFHWRVQNSVQGIGNTAG